MADARAASQTARRLYAHMLIFGQIDERRHLHLQLCLAPQLQASGGLQRLTGSYTFAGLLRGELTKAAPDTPSASTIAQVGDCS